MFPDVIQWIVLGLVAVALLLIGHAVTRSLARA
jgi:hypothetical protein